MLDYMCGTGFLLAQLHDDRPDLRCVGCDFDSSFIEHGRANYQGIDLICESALVFEPEAATDVILCTGGVHHLPRDQRARFLTKCADELKESGHLVVAEQVIATARDQRARRSAVVELYDATFEHLIAADAPPAVLDSAVAALRKELLEDGTSKETTDSLLAVLGESFTVLEHRRIWPDRAHGYGDVIIVCEPKRRRPLSLDPPMGRWERV